MVKNDIMEIFREIYSPIQVNTYVVTGDGNSCVVIDCGCYSADEAHHLEKFLEERHLVPVKLLNTHCHLDHIFGNGFMLDRFNLRSWYHRDDESNRMRAPSHAIMFGLKMDPAPEPEGYLDDGDIISVAGLTIEVLHVPGHSSGGIAFYLRQQSVVFTGDALFAGSIGRSDLPGGDHEQLLDSIRHKLFLLPPETTVYPGHGPETTIGEEIRSNPFFR